jgi:hypothetical protein
MYSYLLRQKNDSLLQEQKNDARGDSLVKYFLAGFFMSSHNLTLVGIM